MKTIAFRSIVRHALTGFLAVSLVAFVAFRGHCAHLEGRRIPALFATHGLAINEDESRLFMVSEFDSIAEVDLRTNQFVRAFAVGGDANLSSGLAYAQGKLYVVAHDRVVVVDPNLETVLSVIDFPSSLGTTKGEAIVSADQSTVYAITGSSRIITVIDVATDQVLQSIELARDFVSLGLSPAEDRLYCVNPETSQLAIIDTETMQIESTRSYAPVDEGALDIVPQVSVGPDGRVFVAFVTPNYRGHVGIFSADGTPLNCIELPGFSTGIACSPDGTRLVTGAGYVLDAANGDVIAHIPTPLVGLYYVIFSKSGDRAFLSNDNDRYINTIDGFIDRPTQIQITGNPSIGERMSVNLDFPGEAFANYQLAVSAGVDRGIRLNAEVSFPLNNDTLLRLSVDPRTRECRLFKGLLDENGRAVASLDLSHHLPGLPSGSSIFFAAVTFDGSFGRDNVATVSNLVEVVLD